MAKRAKRYRKFFIMHLFLMSRKRRNGQLTSNERRRGNVALMFCMRRIMRINAEIRRGAVTVFHPPSGIVTHGVESTFWDDDLFNAFFRFKKAEFLHIMDLMHLTGKHILCGRKHKAQYFPADICLMVLLRRLAFPSRFVDLVLVFGIPSNRICDIYHSMIDYIYFRYAKKLNQFSIWVDKFPEFAQVFRRAGSPYPNQIMNFDGNFKGTCRPGGLGNSGSRLDQSEMYTGEKAQHGIKYLVGQFPNGMTCLAGPFKGKTHDGAMLGESGWTQILAREAAAGRPYVMFGDAGFAVSDYVQSMYREFSGYILRESRTFNTYMSRIRIYIENYFAGMSNVFSYLNFKHSLKLGGRNIGRQYEVANFLMNVRSTFRGNQFTAALGHPCPISLEEFLKMAE